MLNRRGPNQTKKSRRGRMSGAVLGIERGLSIWNDLASSRRWAVPVGQKSVSQSVSQSVSVDRFCRQQQIAAAAAKGQEAAQCGADQPREQDRATKNMKGPSKRERPPFFRLRTQQHRIRAKKKKKKKGTRRDRGQGCCRGVARLKVDRCWVEFARRRRRQRPTEERDVQAAEVSRWVHAACRSAAAAAAGSGQRSASRSRRPVVVWR